MIPEIIKADITKISADAIVNAANSSLLGGGGVDGAIHSAAGPQLLEACKDIRRTKYQKGLPVGEAVATSAYDLNARFVIHTVGPVYGRDDISLLKKCYLNSLKLAEKFRCKSIAFPAISTGVYRVPVELSAKTVKSVLENYPPSTDVILVLYDNESYQKYLEIFK